MIRERPGFGNGTFYGSMVTRIAEQDHPAAFRIGMMSWPESLKKRIPPKAQALKHHREVTTQVGDLPRDGKPTCSLILVDTGLTIFFKNIY